MAKKKTVSRSSKTGKFVTKKYAAKHKATTENETIKPKKKKKKVAAKAKKKPYPSPKYGNYPEDEFNEG